MLTSAGGARARAQVHQTLTTATNLVVPWIAKGTAENGGSIFAACHMRSVLMSPFQYKEAAET